jgi:CRP/FNR family cyclic AMP-dependent transcriptional regulator
MTHRRLSGDTVLFHQGDPIDCVHYLVSGTVEIRREVGGQSILLGIAHPGEFIGEMGVIENRARRSATARAASEVEIEIVPVDGFFERVSNSPATARALLLRLSTRLHEIEDRLAGDVAAHAAAPAAELSLAAHHAGLRKQMGEAPVPLRPLPFVVGRATEPGEAAPAMKPHLVLEDSIPYRLSRAHFTIAKGAAGYVVRDLNSTLGTLVNGKPIGHHFASDTAPLRQGENTIMAGGSESPFAFSILVP